MSQDFTNFPAGIGTGDPGVEITATAAEMNYLDITTLGTGAASKAVVLDSGEDYTWPATGILTYGVLKDPAATTITATGAEINLLDGSVEDNTVASKAASIPEISAKNIFFCEPTDPEDIAKKIKEVFGMSEDKRDNLSKKLIDESKKFSWHRVAAETANVYRSVINFRGQ